VSALSDEEIDRYSRQIRLPEIGGLGQMRLKKARLGLIGMGGIGAPAALYLTGAGIGFLRLIDDDNVSLSNLQRQVLYHTDDIGRPKVECAKRHLLMLNPHTEIEANNVRLEEGNANALLDGLDLVIDGTDQFSTRLLVNQTCHSLNTALIMAAVGRYDGQVALFSRSPCYQCFVPEPPEGIDDCATIGIVGALTGIIGSAAALTAINFLSQATPDISKKQTALWRYEGLSGRSHNALISADPDCPICAGQG
jgi:molybdopterin/thiamine biosynthesis adenylyltransferase